MSRSAQRGVFIALTVILVACGGGGSTGGGSTRGGGVTPGGPTPCPSGYSGTAPTCYAPGTPAVVTGSVVDYNSNAPLSGVRVAITSFHTPQPYSAPSPVAVATTNASGSFSFTASPGPYLLVIGSDSAQDTRATVHDYVSLMPGTNALRAPGPWTQPEYSPPPSESSGNFRLATLNATIQSPCLSAINAIRSQANVAPLVPDEWLEETSLDALQSIENNGAGYLISSSLSGSGFTTCANFFQSSESQNAGLYANSYALWFGGGFAAYTAAGSQGSGGIAVAQIAVDPRVDTSCPSPAPNPAPIPGPNACDAFFEPWPQEPGYFATPAPPISVGNYGPVINLPQPAAEPASVKGSPFQSSVPNGNSSTQAGPIVGFDGSNDAQILYDVDNVTNDTHTSFIGTVSPSAAALNQVAIPVYGTTLSACQKDSASNLWCLSGGGGSIGSSVTEFNSSFAFVKTLTIPGNWDATGLAIDTQGNLWLPTQGCQLDELNASGTLVNSVALGCSSQMTGGVALDQLGDAWVTGGPQGTLIEISTSTLAVVGQYLPTYYNQLNFGGQGIYIAGGPAPAIDPSGNLWLIGNQRFDKVSPSGSILTTIGVYDTAYQATDIVVDSAANAWLLSTCTCNGFGLDTGILTEVSPSGSIVANYELGPDMESAYPAPAIGIAGGNLWATYDGPPNGSYGSYYLSIYPSLAAAGEYSSSLSAHGGAGSRASSALHTYVQRTRSYIPRQTLVLRRAH